MKSRAARFGRAPESILIMPGISPIAGRTENEARERDAVPAVARRSGLGLDMLAIMLGTDLTGHPLDGPLPELVRPEGTGSQSTFDNWTALARRENLTIRQLIARAVGARGKSVIVGTPAQIADHMQSWFENGAADGFNIMPPYLPGALDEFVDSVVPELQARGLVRGDYTGTTLREHLGLARPNARRIPWPRPSDRRVRLGAFFNPTGHHVASWRHPDAQADAGINFAHFVDISRTAERGKFDFVFSPTRCTFAN